jgi:hypothetical protein
MITEISNVASLQWLKNPRLGQNYTRKHQLFQLFYLVTYLYLEVYLKSLQYVQRKIRFTKGLCCYFVFFRFNSESFLYCYVTFKGEGVSLLGLLFISYRAEIKSVIFRFSSLPIRSCFSI